MAYLRRPLESDVHRHGSEDESRSLRTEIVRLEDRVLVKVTGLQYVIACIGAVLVLGFVGYAAIGFFGYPVLSDRSAPAIILTLILLAIPLFVIMSLLITAMTRFHWLFSHRILLAVVDEPDAQVMAGDADVVSARDIELVEVRENTGRTGDCVPRNLIYVHVRGEKHARRIFQCRVDRRDIAVRLAEELAERWNTRLRV